MQAEGNLVVGKAAPDAIGIQRVPASAVHAVASAGAARESSGEGAGWHALLVVQIIVAAGEKLPGEVAARAGGQGQALRQLALLPVINIVREGAGGDIVIVTVDTAISGIG